MDAKRSVAGEETREVAGLMGVNPQDLRSLKIVGPGEVGESVVAADMRLRETADALEVATLRSGRLALLSADDTTGRFVVVSHETGPELFLLTVASGATTSALWATISTIVNRVIERRSADARGEAPIAEVCGRTYEADGTVASERLIRFADDRAMLSFIREGASERHPRGAKVRYPPPTPLRKPAVRQSDRFESAFVFDPTTRRGGWGVGHQNAAMKLAAAVGIEPDAAFFSRLILGSGRIRDGICSAAMTAADPISDEMLSTIRDALGIDGVLDVRVRGRSRRHD